ncbi:MAG: dihydrodipicolinate synthase family protein [Kiritimatiellia bacterium]
MTSTAPLIPPGVWPVMLTPFDDQGAIDRPALDALVDWYIDAGVAGLFAVCLSSEIYELTAAERLELAARVVAKAGGRVPVVAAGAFGISTDEQAAVARRIRDTGVTAVVLTVNQLAAEDEPDTIWRERAEAVFDACDGIPLGLYECPRPYHRTLSPKLLEWAAGTGRVVFYKDTCCSLPVIREKLAAIEGTPLTWFNAHAPTLLDSLRAGGGGYSSIAANFIPEPYVRLCRDFEKAPEEAGRLQEFLTRAQDTIKCAYPRNAKCWLRRLGLPLTTYCRVACRDLTEEDVKALDRLREPYSPVPPHKTSSCRE